MGEREQLIEMNAKLVASVDNVTKSVERLESALLGDKFNNNGIIHRIDTMESKMRKLDKYLWMLVGMFSLGTIPLGVKILPILKEYLK